MTDEQTTEPRTVKLFTCINHRHPTRSCYGLVENTDESRRLHREWHDSLVSKEEGQRKAIKDRDDEIARLHDRLGEYGRAVESYEKQVSGFHGEVQRVETPVAPPTLEITRDGYSDDELGDEPAEPAEDWASLVTAAATDQQTAVDAADPDATLGRDPEEPLPAVEPELGSPFFTPGISSLYTPGTGPVMS